jgi:hypothetical protein
MMVHQRLPGASWRAGLRGRVLRGNVQSDRPHPRDVAEDEALEQLAALSVACSEGRSSHSTVERAMAYLN